MRRMRIRLLFGFLVLLALGHWQERGVLAQKYYMNFAFNNNNPDGAGGGSDMGGNPPGDMHPGPDDHLGYGGNDDQSPGFDNGHVGGDIGDSHGGGGPGEGSGSGSGGGGGADGDGTDGGYGGELAIGTGGGYEGADGPGDGDKIGANGRDDDNDDSDSKDAKDFHQKREEREQGQAKRTDHSHHSSYEISIDDSFGGRYVRSIYESSESHGHSGASSMSGSNDRGITKERLDSSQEGPDHVGDIGDQEPAEAIRDVDGDVPDGQNNVAARAGVNDDYEEM